MSNTEGFGSAEDAEIHAVPAEDVVDEELEARLAAGRVEAHETFLREARENVERAKEKVASCEVDLAHAKDALATCEAEVAALEGGN